MARPAAVEALLELLPPEGQPFHPAAREIWAQAFSTILDLTYGATTTAAPTEPSQPAEAPPVGRRPGRPKGSRNKPGGPVVCPDCGKTPASADAYKQHRRRYHSHEEVRHVSGPPPRPAPTFTPTPTPEPEQHDEPPMSTAEQQARARAIDAYQ